MFRQQTGFGVGHSPDTPVELLSDVTGSEVMLLRFGGNFDCRAPDGQLGRCGPLLDCEHMRNALLPLTTTRLRFLKKSICRFVGGRPLICCPDKPPQLVPTTSAPLFFQSPRRPPAPTPRPASQVATSPSSPGPTDVSGEPSPGPAPAGTSPSITGPGTDSDSAAAQASESPPSEPAEANGSPGTAVPETETALVETTAAPEPETALVETTAVPETEVPETTAVPEPAAPETAGPETAAVPEPAEPGAGGVDLSPSVAAASEGTLAVAAERQDVQSPPGLDVCGHKLAERITGGQESQPSEWHRSAHPAHMLSLSNPHSRCDQNNQ